MVDVAGTTSKPVLVISERVRYMIMAAVNAEPSLEVGGLIKVEPVSGVLTVVDMLIPPQVVTSTHFDVKAEQFVNWIAELAAKVATEESKSVWAVWNGLWHSHCNMGTSPSATDITQLHEWVNDEQLPWFVGLVANLKEEFCGWLQGGSPVPFRTPCEVFTSRVVNKELDAEVEVMMANVTKRTHSSGNTGGSGTGSGRKAGESSRPKRRAKAKTESADNKRIGAALASRLGIATVAELTTFAEQQELTYTPTDEKSKAAVVMEYAKWLLDNIRGENKDDLQCLTQDYETQALCLLPMAHTDEHWALDKARDSVEWKVWDASDLGDDDGAEMAMWFGISSHSGRCTTLVKHPSKPGTQLMCMLKDDHDGAHDPRRPIPQGGNNCTNPWCGLDPLHEATCQSEYEMARDLGECGVMIGGTALGIRCNSITGHTGTHSHGFHSGESPTLAERVAAMDDRSTA